jgi:glycosyltransferase involved in cell wall biosynthesis
VGHHAAGPLRVLFAAAVMPHKGLHRLLDALAGLPAGQARLDVAGSLDGAPGYVRAIRARCARDGLAVRLWGELRDEALWARFRDSHVLALPSDREAYPLAALEALGFGLPVLVTSHGGTAELVAEGVEGHRLQPDDVAAWTARLTELARDRGRLAALGRAALARFQAHGTWAETAATVVALCERVAGGGSGGGHLVSR